MILQERQISRVVLYILYAVIIIGLGQIIFSIWYITTKGFAKTENTDINFYRFTEDINGEKQSQMTLQNKVVNATNFTAAVNFTAEMSSESQDYDAGYSPSDVTMPRCRRPPISIKDKWIWLDLKINSMNAVERKYDNLESGGRFRPTNCRARQRVAIITPYRDRYSHLIIFLNHIHRFLQRQQIDYGIFIVELSPEIKFNRALLMNIGFMEASKIGYNCFIFHDVDLLPLNNNNLYRCSQSHPRHFSVAVDKFLYKLPYKEIFGGVSGLTKHQFQQVNGYSNKYFGWGGEDDDMYKRYLHHAFNEGKPTYNYERMKEALNNVKMKSISIRKIYASNMTVRRYGGMIATYKMLRHKQDVKNMKREMLLNGTKERMKNDGLSSLNYTVLETTKYKLYTHIMTTINMSHDAYSVPELPAYVSTRSKYISPFFLMLLTILTCSVPVILLSFCISRLNEIKRRVF